MINKHETPIKIIELTDMTVLTALIRQIKEAHWLLSTNWFSIEKLKKHILLKVLN